MILYGTAVECAEAIAQVDVQQGYPRDYTEADLGVLIFRRGHGPWAPIDSIRTETAAEPQPVDVDAEGNPTSARRVVRFRLSDDAPRLIVAKARVLRLLNRGTSAQLQELPAINAARAGVIIASRPYAAITDLTGLVPPGVVTALQTRAADSAAEDVDDWVDTESAQQKRRAQ